MVEKQVGVKTRLLLRIKNKYLKLSYKSHFTYLDCLVFKGKKKKKNSHISRFSWMEIFVDNVPFEFQDKPLLISGSYKKTSFRLHSLFSFFFFFQSTEGGPWTLDSFSQKDGKIGE